MIKFVINVLLAVPCVLMEILARLVTRLIIGRRMVLTSACVWITHTTRKLASVYHVKHSINVLHACRMLSARHARIRSSSQMANASARRANTRTNKPAQTAPKDANSATTPTNAQYARMVTI